MLSVTKHVIKIDWLRVTRKTAKNYPEDKTEKALANM